MPLTFALRTWMRRTVTTLVIAASFTVTGKSIAISTALDVHEMAQLCMYTQRVFKDYAMVGMGVTSHDPAKDLTDGIATIDQFLKDMESHHIDDKLDAEVRGIHSEWDVIKAVVAEAPRKEAMADLRSKVETLVKHCVAVADHLAEATGIAGEHEVVLISELGMETQRLAALYMAKAWDAAPADYSQEVARIVDKYKRIEAELQAADDRLVPPETKAALKKLEKDFMVLSFMSKRTGRMVPTLMEKSASRVFEELQIILERVEQHVTGEQ